MSLQPSQPSAPRDPWGSFSADPRVAEQTEVRASDADRDLIAGVLADAYAEGRLDQREYTERLEKAMTVKRVGEISPLISDLVIAGGQSTSSAPKTAEPVTEPHHQARVSLSTWAAVAIITNLVWLLTSLSTGRLIYYWPMWPMFGVGIPVIVMYLFRDERAEQTPVRKQRDRRRLKG